MYFFEFCLLFTIGLLAGLITALPIGPTNLWIAKAVMPPAKANRNIKAFIAGLIFLDGFYATLAFWGYGAWAENSIYSSAISQLCGVILVIIGISGIRTAYRVGESLNKSSEELTAATSTSLGADFLTGLLLGSNPVYIAYWLTVASLTTVYGPQGWGILSFIVIFSGIVGGDLLWYALFLRVLRKYLSGVSVRFAFYSQLIIGFIFVAVGVYTAFSLN